MQVRGKELKLKSEQNYKTYLGTINTQEPRCVYFNIKSWATPKDKVERDYNKIVKTLNKRIKQQLFTILPESNFHPKISLVDTDLRDSGIRFGKKSYFNCEVTLYQKDVKDLRELPQDVEKITHKIIQDTLEPFEYLKFTNKK